MELKQRQQQGRSFGFESRYSPLEAVGQASAQGITFDPITISKSCARLFGGHLLVDF